jgi:16S rRNA (guanine527-N7)-methyltransferase
MDGQIDLILRYFPDVTENQKKQFAGLQYIYSFWNERINVISRKDIEFLQERHILHSLSIAKFINFMPETRVMDAGTGGGFPGIPLSILFPECHFMLVDSIGKKIQVVREVAAYLGLKNVVVRQERVEKIRVEFDYIVSRAVTRLARFYAWTKGKIKKSGINEHPNGIILLKGGDLSSEINDLNKSVEVYDIYTYFRESFFTGKKIVFIPEP